VTQPIPMTAQQYAQARALAEGATAGPWQRGVWSAQCHMDHGDESHGRGKCVYDPVFYETDHDISRDVPSVLVVGQYDYDEGGVVHLNDAAFIAESRELLPAALAWIEQAVPLLRDMDYCTQPYAMTPEISERIERLYEGFGARIEALIAGFPPTPQPEAG
jgi:hypothetical protein